MQYGSTHAFMVRDQVLIQRPKMKPVQAAYKNKVLTPTDVDPELAEDAMAHALLPGYLYREQLYCLQEEGIKKEPPRLAWYKRFFFHKDQT
jgi:hypothetical protein